MFHVGLVNWGKKMEAYWDNWEEKILQTRTETRSRDSFWFK